MKCYYEKTLFSSEQNGFCIVVYKTDDELPKGAAGKYPSKDGKPCFTAVGTRLPSSPGVEVTFSEKDGKWTTGKFGLQFNATGYTVAMPKTKENIAAYLASDLICGIGEKTAKLIVDKFGENTISVIENQPSRLLEISGISQSKLDKIMVTYNQSTGLRNIVAQLAPFGVSVKKSAKIQETFGGQAFEVVKHKTYSLCNIKGFGFKTVDIIAQKMGLSQNDPMRIMHALMFELEQSKLGGHLFLPCNKLCDNTYKLLNGKAKEGVVELSEVEEQLYFLVTKLRLVNENGNIYHPKNYAYEVETAKIIAEFISSSQPKLEISKVLEKVETDLGFTLSMQQAEAVKMCFAYNLSIITGGPGTGKTTIIKAILGVYKKTSKGKILLSAPTGRASRRIAESSGYAAVTLHSALGIGMNNAVNKEEKEPLDVDLIIIDEFSMVDMELMWILFKRIKPGTKIVLVGDKNQLPSVGAGNVFAELIQSKVIPITILDAVYRQSGTSRIALNAHSILQNETKLLRGTDFVMLNVDDKEQAPKLVEQAFMQAVSDVGLNNVQILTPVRTRGDCGANALNKAMQDILNPKESTKAEIFINSTIYRIGDKVMQTKNKDTISNGDMGVIKSVFKGKDGDTTVGIDFLDGRIINYSVEDMESVDLAYAVTIHKSQGSEYDTVIIPILTEFYFMLQRNLIYTAITRAKGKVVIVCQYKALYAAIHKNDTVNRNTMLAKRIVELANKNNI